MLDNNARMILLKTLSHVAVVVALISLIRSVSKNQNSFARENIFLISPVRSDIVLMEDSLLCPIDTRIEPSAVLSIL